MISIANTLKLVADSLNTRYQFLHECATGAVYVKRKGDTPAHTKITFASTGMNPVDLLNPSGSEFVGIVVWVPRAEYEAALNSDAADR